MVPYVVAFLLSSLVVYFASTRCKMPIVFRFSLWLIADIIVSILAAVRDFSVAGPDADLYGVPLFLDAVGSDSFRQLEQYANFRGISGEWGYVALNYVVSRFSSDPHWFFFFLGMLTYGVVLGAIKVINIGSPTLMWLTYLLMGYIDTCNLLRQSPAMSLSILGIALLFRKHYVIGLLVSTSTILFHGSGVVAIFLFLLSWLLYRHTFLLRTRIASVLLLASIVVVYSPQLMPFASELVSDKYEVYLSNNAFLGNPLGVETLYRLIPIIGGILVLLASRRATFGDNLSRSVVSEYGAIKSARQSPHLNPARWMLGVLIVVLVIELILLPTRTIAYPIYRVINYFGMVRVFAYSIIAELSPPKIRKLVQVAIILFCLLYFFYMYIWNGIGIYSSQILDQLL